METPRRKFFVAFLVILALSVPLWPGFDRSATPMDEASLLVYPELVLKGQLPYRDFETFYGPANLWVLSAAYAGFGPSIFTERAVGLSYRVLALLAIFALVQRWGTTLAAGCTAVASLLLLPIQLGAYAWIGGAICALWSIWMIAKPESARRCLLGGVLAGLALLFRVDLGPAVIASALPLFLLMRTARRWSYLGGAAFALLPLGWLTAVAGPKEILNNLLLFPVIYSSPARHLPIFSAENYLVLLFFAHIIAVAGNIFAGVIAIRTDRRSPMARLLLSLALLGLAVTHQAAQRLDLIHVMFVAFISIGVLPLSIFVIWSHSRVTMSRPGEAALVTAVVLLLVEGIAPEVAATARAQVIAGLGGQIGTTVFLARHGRSFPFSSMNAAIALGKMLDQLDALAAPGERVFVGPADLRRTNQNETFIYHLLPQLRPATYFLEMNPRSANRPNSRLGQDIASADWLVLTHRFDGWNEPNKSAELGSDQPMRVVKDQFELCGQYGGRDLYRRRTSTVTKL
jgi:hypothetical protein